MARCAAMVRWLVVAMFGCQVACLINHDCDEARGEHCPGGRQTMSCQIPDNVCSSEAETFHLQTTVDEKVDFLEINIRERPEEGGLEIAPSSVSVAIAGVALERVLPTWFRVPTGPSRRVTLDVSFASGVDASIVKFDVALIRSSTTCEHCAL